MLYKRGFFLIISIISLVFFIEAGISPVLSFTDQITTERVLDENKAFIYFIDPCVTNFAPDKYEQFKEIYQLHFNAMVTYLQSDYRGSFKRVYASEKKGADLYSDMVKNLYLENSKDILDQLAPDIIRSKNARAKLYLSLAYRDRALCMNYYLVGDASNPKLYSYKIYKYSDAVKMARRAKRYGFLALYESQPDQMKLAIYNHLFATEKEAGSLFYNRFLNKSGDAFIQELNNEIKDDIDSVINDKPADKKVSDKSEEKKETAAAPDTNKAKEITFEKRIERRVRFRNEKTVAAYLLNSEFEKGEDIIRKYIDDFNFKLIKATFEVLAAKNKDSEVKINYGSFLIHHTDNYARLSKSSALDSFAGKVKVEDFVEKSPSGPAGIEDSAAVKKDKKEGAGTDTAAEKKEGVKPDKKEDVKPAIKEEKKNEPEGNVKSKDLKDVK